MAIDTVLNPVGMAQKLSIPQLQKAIQDGTIPAYVGIPVLQEKINMDQRVRNAAARPPTGPTVAQQVMAQAQGLNQLQSNLPEQFAGGGIVAFAEGDLIDDEDEDDDFDKEMRRAISQMDVYRRHMDALREQDRENMDKTMSTFTLSEPFTARETSKGVSVKEGNQPARTVSTTEKSVSRPGGLEDLLALVKQKESGGRRYDQSGNLLTSPKGAMGEMQVMPATSRDPGFGIRPARAGDAEDLARVGREYYAAMLDRYGDPKLAAIAYNMGPGATDKWIMAGADMARLPEETRRYSQGFAEGGIAKIKHFQLGGLSAVDLMSANLADVQRMAQMGEPGAAEELKRRLSNARTFEKFNISPEAQQMRDQAARNLRGEQLRQTFGAPAAPAAAAPAEAPSFMNSLKSAISRIRPGVGGLGVGLPALLYSGDLNANEEQELARRRAMAPTSNVTPAPVTPAAPSAGAGRGGQGGPTAAQAAKNVNIFKPFGDIDLSATDESLGAVQPVVKEEKTEEKPAAETPFAQALRDRLTRGYDRLEKQQETDKYLSLLAAGLGIMGGRSPFASENIGTGALQGIQTLQQARANTAAQERALLSAELGLERYGQYGELQKEYRLMREQAAAQERERKREQSIQTEAGKAEGRRLRAGQIAARMEQDVMGRAEATARAAIKGNTLLAMDEAKSAAFIEEARNAAKNKLNISPLYRKYVREATEGYDPGEIDVNADISGLITKYLKPQK